MGPLIALEHILLNSIPTFILVWLLYLFISKAFLKPLGQVLKKRAAATEGLRQTAESKLSLAEQKTAEYHGALRAGSAEIYQQQEQDRRQALERRAESVRRARESAEQKLAQARQELMREAEEAKQQLAQQSEQMALWITQAVLAPPSPAAVPAGRAAAPVAPGKELV